ncbi:NUDIX domain-containing protein [archaeon]|nr:NUDIX domain-containing protein [archaeon]
MRKGHSSGVIIINKSEGQNKVLLMKSYNFWDFPKGGIEGNENKLETAIREVIEETGIDDLQFNWGKTYYETESFGKNRKIVFYFIAETTKTKVVMGISPLLGLPEHDEYKWVTFDEANSMVVERIQKALAWAQNRVENIY